MTASTEQDWPFTAKSGRRPRSRWTRWDDDRVRRLTDLWMDPATTIAEIADALETGESNVRLQASKRGLPPKAGGAHRAKRRFSGFHGKGDGQRRFLGKTKHEGARVQLGPWHPALRAGTTLFPSTVMPAAQMERLLKSGQNSSKIGKVMAKGRWKGMPLFTLTLEERATCPRSCLQWSTCYGNNMHMAQRVHDDGTLMTRLTSELVHLAFCHPQGFIVRLHVLGDFNSVEYVQFWRDAMVRFPNLRIFGFTARQPDDPVGRAVLELMRDFYDRVAMRISGGGYDTDCAEVVDRPEDATGIRCPAETDATRCCATCALCMQTNRTISFVRH